MEQMIIAGIELGITENEALELTLQTALGAARLASREQQDTPTSLREKVTSPGGTTQSALQTFKDHGMDEAFRLGIKTPFYVQKKYLKSLEINDGRISQFNRLNFPSR